MNNLYKVLWVDDDESIVQSFSLRAEIYGIDLVHTSNWECAQEMLQRNFTDYVAIILDAQCKLNRKDEVAHSDFLGTAVEEMKELCRNRATTLPWYVLSAGTMDGFDPVMRIINNADRRSKEKEWGKLIYAKASHPDQVDELFENIQRVARLQPFYQVMARHKEVFDCLGEGRNFPSTEMREILLHALWQHYEPEKVRAQRYTGNDLRKVLEHMCHVLHERGVLHPAMIINQNGVSLTTCSYFLSGQKTELNLPSGKENWWCNEPQTYWEEGTKKTKVQPIIERPYSDYLRLLIHYGNNASHGTSGNHKQICDDSREMFDAHLFLLCRLITYVNDYLQQHPDKSANLAQHHQAN